MLSTKVAPSSSSSPLVPSTPLASLACLGCKTSKKGCDKKLPSCSHCARRSVICHYEAPATAKGLAEANAPDLVLMPPATSAMSPWLKTGDYNVLGDNHPSNRAFLKLIDSLSPSRGVPTTADRIFHLRVCEIIRAYGAYVDDITVRYFEGVHRWLPIISRSRFHDRLVVFESPAVADFSVLLLCMCLITHHPEQKTSDNDQQALYVTTKMLFAHAQALISTSTSMIQAGLLIATYEYGHGLLEAAYVSIGTCARMGFIAGLHGGQFGRPSPGVQSSPLLKEEEEHNLWWGIIVSERFIMAEKSIANKPFVVELPDADEYLPVDFYHLDQGPRTDLDSSHYQRVSAFDSQGVGSFGREVQAAYLYTGVQEAMFISEPSVAMTQLKLLDSKLQRFFSDIMCQSGTTWGLYCGSLAFTIGALFDLHEFVLNQSEFHELHETSKVALEATVRMVVDVARSFNQRAPSVEVLPPRCSHLARAARNLLDTSAHATYEESEMSLSEVRNMLTCLDVRWRMAGNQLARLETISGAGRCAHYRLGSNEYQIR